MTASDLPLLNAVINSLCTVCLLAGWIKIRRGERDAHKKFMIGAVTLSTLFLVSYLTYHLQVGSVKYTGTGTIRTVYFTVLISHTILAMTLPVLVPITVVRGLKNILDKHRRIARITLPIWLYVSVTGVLIYMMLYQWPHQW